MKRKALGLKSKKGNAISDGILVLVILIAFVFFIFFGKFVFNAVNDDIQADTDMSTEAKEISSSHNARYGNLFDGLFLFVFVLLWALVLIASFKIDTHPLFFIFTVILLIAVFMVAAYLGNVYNEFATDDDIAAIAPSFPMANWIMSHFLTVAIIVGFSIVLVMFGKNRLSQ